MPAVDGNGKKEERSKEMGKDGKRKHRAVTAHGAVMGPIQRSRRLMWSMCTLTNMRVYSCRMLHCILHVENHTLARREHHYKDNNNYRPLM